METQTTPQTVEIFGKRAKLFRDGDIPVYVIEDGRFAVFKDAQWKAFRSIKGVDNESTRELPAVKLMLLSDAMKHDKANEEYVNVYNVVAWKKSHIYLTNNQRKMARYTEFFLYDKEAADAWVKLQAKRLKLLAQIESLELAFEKAHPLEKVREHNFREFQEQCQPKS